MKRKLQASGVLLILFGLAPVQMALGQAERKGSPTSSNPRSSAENARGDREQPDEPSPDPIAEKIVAAARAQVGNVYDASYKRIPYPNGDVPGDRGLCADVVVRALRAVGHDLQYLIHEDRKSNFQQYPRLWGWGRRAPDSSSDHRVVPNQMFFLGRFGLTLTRQVSRDTLGQWRPGDMVYWKSGSPLLHAGIVSDRLNDAGLPLVIHMTDAGCVEDNSLLAWPIIGHFRLPTEPTPASEDSQDEQGNQDGQDQEDASR